MTTASSPISESSNTLKVSTEDYVNDIWAPFAQEERNRDVDDDSGDESNDEESEDEIETNRAGLDFDFATTSETLLGAHDRPEVIEEASDIDAAESDEEQEFETVAENSNAGIGLDDSTSQSVTTRQSKGTKSKPKRTTAKKKGTEFAQSRTTAATATASNEGIRKKKSKAQKLAEMQRAAMGHAIGMSLRDQQDGSYHMEADKSYEQLMSMGAEAVDALDQVGSKSKRSQSRPGSKEVYRNLNPEYNDYAPSTEETLVESDADFGIYECRIIFDSDPCKKDLEFFIFPNTSDSDAFQSLPWGAKIKDGQRRVREDGTLSNKTHPVGGWHLDAAHSIMARRSAVDKLLNWWRLFAKKKGYEKESSHIVLRMDSPTGPMGEADLWADSIKSLSLQNLITRTPKFHLTIETFIPPCQFAGWSYFRKYIDAIWSLVEAVPDRVSIKLTDESILDANTANFQPTYDVDADVRKWSFTEICRNLGIPLEWIDNQVENRNVHPGVIRKEVVDVYRRRQTEYYDEKRREFDSEFQYCQQFVRDVQRFRHCGMLPQRCTPPPPEPATIADEPPIANKTAIQNHIDVTSTWKESRSASHGKSPGNSQDQPIVIDTEPEAENEPARPSPTGATRVNECKLFTDFLPQQLLPASPASTLTRSPPTPQELTTDLQSLSDAAPSAQFTSMAPLPPMKNHISSRSTMYQPVDDSFLSCGDSDIALSPFQPNNLLPQQRIVQSPMPDLWTRGQQIMSGAPMNAYEEPTLSAFQDCGEPSTVLGERDFTIHIADDEPWRGATREPTPFHNYANDYAHDGMQVEPSSMHANNLQSYQNHRSGSRHSVEPHQPTVARPPIQYAPLYSFPSIPEHLLDRHDGFVNSNGLQLPAGTGRPAPARPGLVPARSGFRNASAGRAYVNMTSVRRAQQLGVRPVPANMLVPRVYSLDPLVSDVQCTLKSSDNHNDVYNIPYDGIPQEGVNIPINRPSNISSGQFRENSSYIATPQPVRPVTHAQRMQDQVDFNEYLQPNIFEAESAQPSPPSPSIHSVASSDSDGEYDILAGFPRIGQVVQSGHGMKRKFIPEMYDDEADFTLPKRRRE